MRLEYLTGATLSPAAEERVRFDMDSIRQIVKAMHGNEPQVWVADPSAYEKDGRVLRDSPDSRILAYSAEDRVVYACDGCNTCTRRLEGSLESLSSSELQSFAAENDLRFDLLKRLI